MKPHRDPTAALMLAFTFVGALALAGIVALMLAAIWEMLAQVAVP
jgi:hypothetical protein